MPFILRYPREVKPGSVNDDMVLNLDFAPLFLDLAGAPIPEAFQGRSFLPLLRGQTPADWRQAMYYRYWMHNTSDHHVPAHYGIRTRKWKLIYYYGKPLGMKGANGPETPPEWELFDLRRDPREMKNVYGDPANRALAGKLERQLATLQAACGDSPA